MVLLHQLGECMVRFGSGFGQNRNRKSNVRFFHNHNRNRSVLSRLGLSVFNRFHGSVSRFGQLPIILGLGLKYFSSSSNIKLVAI